MNPDGKLLKQLSKLVEAFGYNHDDLSIDADR